MQFLKRILKRLSCCALILVPVSQSRSLAGGCVSVCPGQDKGHLSVLYQEIVRFCEGRFPQYRPYPSYLRTRKLRQRLEKGSEISDSDKAGLMIRRLVKQSPSLNSEIVEEILADPRIRGVEFATLESFVSVFGILASTRQGFVRYYPELKWPGI